MIKKICILTLLTLTMQNAFAETIITGGIGYNVTRARNELTSPNQNTIDKKYIKTHAYDYKHRTNLNCLLKGEVNQKDRILAMFSDYTYAIMYFEDQLHVYYYKNDGSLLYVEEKTSTQYPYKTYKYDTSGNLVNMSLRTSKEETFIFSPNGKLIAHWVGKNGYDEKGNIIMTREYAE